MRIGVVDLGAVYWTAWHATASEDVSHARERTVRQVLSFAQRHDCCAVCLDSPRSFRKEEWSAYKAERPPKPAGAIEQLRQAIAEIEAAKLVTVQFDGFEGDDAIATVVDWATSYERAAAEVHEVTILGADKDLYQLLSPLVTIENHQTGKVFTVADLHAKAGITPQQVPDFLALVGDKADGLPGIDGVGAKLAAQLLGRFGDLEELHRTCQENVTALHEMPGVGPAKVAKLIDAWSADPNPMQVRSLARLRIADDYDGTPILSSVAAPESFTGRKEEPVTMSNDNEQQQIIEAEWAPLSAREEPSTPGTPGTRRALARRDVEYERQLEPVAPNEAWHMAQKLHQSGLFKTQNVNAAFALIVAGRSYGLDMVQSLRGMHIIEGKPTLSAGLMHALCLRHPDCEYFQLVESTSERATFETKRRGSPTPTRMTFDSEDARRADLLAKQNWRRYPKAMLRARCIAELARAVYPDALHGTYLADELGADVAEEAA